MPEFVTKWGYFEFDKPLELVRRDSLQPGDVAYSSHYGRSTVDRVTFLGNEDQSTHIHWVSTNLDHLQHEIYDSESEIPLISRAAEQTLTVERLAEALWRASLPDDVTVTFEGKPWTSPTLLHLAARVRSEIEGIDRQKEQTK